MQSIIKTLLHEWLTKKLPDIYPRHTTLKEFIGLTPKKIIAITGFRRSGKTYLTLSLIQELLKTLEREDVVYLNFEDERVPLKTEILTHLFPTIKETFGKLPKFLFLDEIQNIPEWSKWLRRIYDSNEEIEIFVTGSSSKMSSQEIPTELRGRCLEVKVFPLSFKEFLEFKNQKVNLESALYSTDHRALVLNNLSEYLKYGALPEVVLFPEAKKLEVLQQYYQSVIQKDVIDRFKIKNQEGLKALLRLLLNSTSYSVNKLYNTLKSLNYKIGKTVLLHYIASIETSYFLYSLPIFSYKIKDQLQYARKVYFIDNGFLTALSTQFSENLGRFYENLVFIELKRRAMFGEEFFYWKDRTNHEVDFVCKDSLKIKRLIQVCYTIENEEIKKREISSLLKASLELQCDEMLVITSDHEATETFKNKTIRFTPLWKWLLE